MMVINRHEVKRKRKDGYGNCFLDDSPKRTKVHAQRKFAQGSSISSPVITPAKEIERQEKTKPEVVPEFKDFLTANRPNTEDFLTFLCFRGTPILPPNLNIFSNVSPTNSSLKPREPTKEQNNGPIATGSAAKFLNGTNERPFIAFGVRKRADPIVISKQMDKKRRHALALQALRRKYQEQRLAKIRAVTTSTMTDKMQGKPMIRTTRSISKNEVSEKKAVTERFKLKVKANEQVKIIRSVNKPLKPSKPKMCLRSYRGRLIHRELKFKSLRRKIMPDNKLVRVLRMKKKRESASDFSSDDDQPLVKTVKKVKSTKQITRKCLKKPAEVRLTRSTYLCGNNLTLRRHHFKQKILVKKTPVKPVSTAGTLPKAKVQKSMRQVQQHTNEQRKKSQEQKSVELKKIIEAVNADDANRLNKIKKPPVEQILKHAKKEEPQVSQRPTRKTKEAAAIYMEILGHKLISEDNNDEDNVSIDSFPELPNVRKTEQRENELKAIAKVGVKHKKIKEMPKALKQIKNIENKSNITNKGTKPLLFQTKSDIRKNISLGRRMLIRRSKKECNKDLPNMLKSQADIKEKTVKKNCSIQKQASSPLNSNQKSANGKLPSAPKSEIKQSSLKSVKPSLKRVLTLRKPKSYAPNHEMKRRFRNESNGKTLSVSKTSSNTIVGPSKVAALNKTTIVQNAENQDSPNVAAQKIKVVKVTNKSSTLVGRVETNFNDSDEEPLSKLTWIKTKHKSEKQKIFKRNTLGNKITKKEIVGIMSVTQNKSDTNTKKVPLRKVRSHAKSGLVESTTVESENPIVKNEDIGKSKHECSMMPENYLPPFSSGDDEKVFHGFVKVDTAGETFSENKCTAVVASADLLRKDVGRRFGKGKVNMSNEQIEKWLKDSAMAGTSLKKENDEMLKFGEKLPTETTLDPNIQQIIDTDKLKLSLLKTTSYESDKKDISVDNKQQLDNFNKSHSKVYGLNQDKQVIGKMECLRKPISNDRKLIFRKGKQLVPNANAFSASNESSIYAFGEENEDAINTPFRRPSRRPSSTATSRSEDDVSKSEEPSKNSGLFRLPSVLKSDVKLSNKQETVTVLLEDDVVPTTTIPLQIGLDSSETPADNSKFESPKKVEPETADNLHCANLKSNKQTLRVIQNVSTRLPTSSGANLRSLVGPHAATFIKTCGDKASSSASKTKSVDKSTLKHSVAAKNLDRNIEISDDTKYKVPYSPNANSSGNSKIKRHSGKMKTRVEMCMPVNTTEFPSVDVPAQIVEAPTFYPNDKEFQDPIEYIEKIRQSAEKFGICRIVPPSNFKPECKVSDDMRFTSYNQYVHKLLHRWGPNFKELAAIRKYLKTQNISLTQPPWIGGMEIDLPRLYQTVQTLGGLKEVIEKKKWPKVSELMKIPKSAQDRVTKLDDIYCKYLLPYDTLSPVEREKLFDEVETEWAKRESKTFLKVQQKISSESYNSGDSDSDSDSEAEECIVKGRNMALNTFYRIARNTMSMWFKTADPSVQEVEQEFWKHVSLRQNHICVHSGSIDSGNWGYGFAVSKNSPFARHAWNLKILTNNSGSVLRSMGPIMGVTVPTLHVGMVFSACCWYRDPHRLPWIEYLHTGGNKIWYGIPDSMSNVFHKTLTKLVPNYCRNKSLWLPSDTAMVPPSILVENGVSLSRTAQEPGQFVVVFPKVFTCSVSTGYVVSESVYFAPSNWLKTAEFAFNELRENCEPSMFSLDRLLLSVASDIRSHAEVLKLIIPAVQKLCDTEKTVRKKLRELGVVVFEKLPLPDAPGARKRKKLQEDGGDYECEICRKNLFVSLVVESEEVVYCLDHGVECIVEGKVQSKNCKMLFTYDDQELEELVDKLKVTLENKLQKKIHGTSNVIK